MKAGWLLRKVLKKLEEPYHELGWKLELYFQDEMEESLAESHSF